MFLLAVSMDTGLVDVKKMTGLGHISHPWWSETLTSDTLLMVGNKGCTIAEILQAELDTRNNLLD